MKNILIFLVFCFLFGFIYFTVYKEEVKNNIKKDELIKIKKDIKKPIQKNEKPLRKKEVLNAKEKKKIVTKNNSKELNFYSKIIDTLNNQNLKALLISIQNNDYETFIKLYKNYKNRTNQFFFMAASSLVKDKKIIDVLYKDNKKELLRYIDVAVYENNFEYLDYLIESKGLNIDGDENHFSLKMFAFSNNNQEALSWVEERTGTYNSYDYKNVQKIIKLDSLSIEKIQRFIDEGFDFDDEFYSKKLSQLTYFDSNIKLADYLYNSASSINTKIVTPNGERNAILNAVFFSSGRKNLEQIKWYEQHGYDIYARDNQGNGILDLAVESKREDVILYYLKEGFVFKEKKSKISSYDDLYNKAKKNKLSKVVKYMEGN